MKQYIPYIIVAVLLLLTIFFMFFTSNTPVPTQRELQARANPSYAHAYFAGGCFWCVESDFEKFKGVQAVISGYSGGDQPNPTYQNHADHREAVEVVYDADVISYQDLVEYFYRHHDPTDAGGSFYDRGHSYTAAIYYQNESEKQIADMVMMDLEKAAAFDKPIATAIEQFKNFTDAEDYHQNYHSKNPIRYKGYRAASGRDARFADIAKKIDNVVQPETEHVEDVEKKLENTETTTMENKNTHDKWSDYQKPSDAEVKAQLTDIQYQVTQHEGTEAPHSAGNHDDEKRPGIFVDLLSGEPLYSSRDKFDSGTGWPSFTQPIDMQFIVEKTDYKLVWPRTEIRSKYGDNHIGHVFSDGPADRGGLRYCMNGAAMRFVPLENMESEGYKDYIDAVE